MVNDNEESIRRKYELQGYRVLRNGSPDYLIFKYDDNTKKITDVQWIEVKAGSDRLSYEQAVYFMVLQSLGLKATVEYIQPNHLQPNHHKSRQDTQMQIISGQNNPNQIQTGHAHPNPYIKEVYKHGTEFTT